MSDFDLYKENIQPRRRGHTAAELENLSKSTDPEFLANRRLEEAEWEAKLREEGDQVSTWAAYVHWAEQNLFNQLQLNQLRQKMLVKFMNETYLDEFGNNESLFAVFLQSADDSRNWRDRFSYARAKGFFRGLATFWCHWAERFELDSMVKDADRVLAQGEETLRGNKDEHQKLEKWRADFDLRIATGVSIQAPAEHKPEIQPERQPQRRGLAMVASKADEKKATSKGKKRQKGIGVYNDSEVEKHTAGLQGGWGAKQIPANREHINEKENKNQAEKWNVKSSTSKTRAVITRPRVEVLFTETDQSPPPTATIKSINKTVLRESKASRRDVFMELISSEQSNSAERVMYRKNEVYLGLKEMSFEELRAQKWEKYKNVKTPVRPSLRDEHGEFIERPMVARCNFDDESFHAQDDGDELDDDLVCGVLPDTPIQVEKTKKSKFRIFTE